MGTSKVGRFDIPGEMARAWLQQPNPRGVSNADVLHPWANGQELVGRPLDKWIIDFGVDMSAAEAALYQAPFAYVQKHVKPDRAKQRRDAYCQRWWIHAEARPGLRKALRPLSRFIATPRVAKHRFFVWLPTGVIPDSRLFAICRDDDFTFGVLSSRIHSVWALANASRHGVGNDPTYNARDCFETFPFPSRESAVLKKVEAASRDFHSLREEWLNPPMWVERSPEIVSGLPERLLPRLGYEADLKSRTMTNLYNDPPTWLTNAQSALDGAVAMAYGWSDYSADMNADTILSRLLTLNYKQASDLFAGSNRPIRTVQHSNQEVDSRESSRIPNGPRRKPGRSTQGDLLIDNSVKAPSNVKSVTVVLRDNRRKPAIRVVDSGPMLRRRTRDRKA